MLPKEAIQAMKVHEGSELYITEAPEDSIRLSHDAGGFSKKMEVAEDLMQRYRNALRELAK